MSNCLTCIYAKWFSENHGECSYPTPPIVSNLQFRRGIWGKLENGKYGTDYNRIGVYYSDGSVVEIKGCLAWEERKD